MTFTVRRGRRYRAHVKLGIFEQVVTDAALAEKFREVGFRDVSVVGEGRERWAFGTWPRDDATAELPDQITGVVDIGGGAL